MSSGVKVTQDCLDAFERCKMKKEHPWIIFRLTPDYKEIIVDVCGDKNASYDDFKAKLDEAANQKECRYAVYDLDYTYGEDNAQKNKIIFVAWSPDTSKIKEKMIYSSSKDYLKKALKLTVEVQATDDDEVSKENFIERARRTNTQ